jgi:uncharacterized protein involved in exopolysaccharide biosynthesis
VSPSDRSPADFERGIDFVALWRIVWAHRYLIVGLSLLVGAGAVVLALISPPVYRAEVTVTEAQEGGMGGLPVWLASTYRLAGLQIAKDKPP